MAFVNVGTRSSFSAVATVTPALPSPLTVGNLLISHVAIKNNATISTPAGWTKINQTNSGTGLTSAVYWKFAASGETAPVFTWTGSVAGFAQIAQYDNVQGTNPIGASSAFAGTGTTHASTAVNIAAGSSWVIYLDAGVANTALAVPSGWTEDFDNGSATGATTNAGGHKAVSTPGTSSGTISVVGSAGVYVQHQIEVVLASNATVFDSANKATDVTLAAGNLQATKTATSDHGARTVASFRNVKVYAELQVGTGAGSSGYVFGVVNGTWSPNTYPGSDTNSWGIVDGGDIRTNSLNQGPAGQAGAAVDNGRMCIAIDDTVTPRRGWFKGGSGTWQGNSGAGDPTVPSTGFDLSGLGAAGTLLYLAAQAYATGRSFTLRAAAGDWANAAPSGYVPLDASGLPRTTVYQIDPPGTPTWSWSADTYTAGVADPDGGTKATRVTNNAGTSRQVYEGFFPPSISFPAAGKYVVQADMLATGPAAFVRFVNAVSVGADRGIEVDLKAGTVLRTRQDQYGGVVDAYGCIPLGNGWFTVWLSFTLSAAATMNNGNQYSSIGITDADFGAAGWDATQTFANQTSLTVSRFIVAQGSTPIARPAVTGATPLTANAVTTSTPQVGSPALGQKHALTGNAVTTSTPQIGAPALGQTHVLPAGSPVVTSAPQVGSPTLVSGSTRPWTPADDTSGVLRSWVDIADAATLTDAGGGVISFIADKAAGAGTWVGSAGKRGTRDAANANFNGKPTITVPGLGGYTNSTVSLPQSMRMGVSPDGGNGFQISLDGTDGGPNGAISAVPTNAIFGTRWTAGETYGPSGANNAGQYFLTGNQAPISYSGDSTITATASGATFAAARLKSASTYQRFVEGAAGAGGPCLLNRASDWQRTGDMDLGELIVLAGTVSTALRQQYEGYLAWKWGLQADLPAGHPYKTAAPAVATGGSTVALTANPVTTSTPQVNVAVLGQTHALAASVVTTSAPQVGNATQGQKHTLTGNVVATSAPAVGSPSLGQTHGLGVPTAVATTAPQVGAAAFGQVHALAGLPAVTSAPQVGSPSMVPTSALTATPVATSSPQVGTPTLGQTHVLTGSPAVTATAAPGMAVLGQTHQLGTPQGITTSSPAAGLPGLAQTHALSGVPVVTAPPVVSNAVAGVVGQLSAQPLVGFQPAIGQPVLGQTHNLGTPTPAVTSAPVVDLPIMRQINSLAGQPIVTSAPVVGAPAIGQTHALTGNPAVTGTPQVCTPAMTQSAQLTALPVVTGVPAVGSPNVGQEHRLSAGVPATGGTPAVGQPGLAQTHVLGLPPPISTGQPVVSMPAIGQVHVLQGIAVVAEVPIAGHPRLRTGKGDSSPPAVWLAI
ncbi:MAG: hypothetical protein U1E62_21805 [Alsobacter sp.]